jgi:hypothetical protein
VTFFLTIQYLDLITIHKTSNTVEVGFIQYHPAHVFKHLEELGYNRHIPGYNWIAFIVLFDNLIIDPDNDISVFQLSVIRFSSLCLQAKYGMKLDNRDIESNGGINPNLHWYNDIHNFS